MVENFDEIREILIAMGERARLREIKYIESKLKAIEKKRASRAGKDASKGN